VGTEVLEFLEVFRVPELDGLVAAGRSDERAIRAEDDGADAAGMSLAKLLDVLAVLGIPDADGAVGPTAGDESASLLNATAVAPTFIGPLRIWLSLPLE